MKHREPEFDFKVKYLSFSWNRDGEFSVNNTANWFIHNADSLITPPPLSYFSRKI